MSNNPLLSSIMVSAIEDTEIIDVFVTGNSVVIDFHYKNQPNLLFSFLMNTDSYMLQIYQIEDNIMYNNYLFEYYPESLNSENLKQNIEWLFMSIHDIIHGKLPDNFDNNKNKREFELTLRFMEENKNANYLVHLHIVPYMSSSFISAALVQKNKTVALAPNYFVDKTEFLARYFNNIEFLGKDMYPVLLDNFPEFCKGKVI